MSVVGSSGALSEWLRSCTRTHALGLGRRDEQKQAYDETIPLPTPASPTCSSVGTASDCESCIFKKK